MQTPGFSAFRMKFVPRQPPLPLVRPPSATSTRFLRLQPAENAPSLENAPKFEPRPLPEFIRPVPPPPSPSQRVRLWLDPEVASQPLPPPPPELAEPIGPAVEASPPESYTLDEAPVAEVPANAAEPAAALEAEPAAGEVAVADLAIAEAFPPFSGEASPADHESLPVVENLPPSPYFEIPPVAETMNKVWFPPPPKSPTVPLWTPVVPAPTSTAAPAGLDAAEPSRMNSRPSLNLSARRREPASTTEESAPARRPAPSLAHLARPPQSLGAGFWVLLVLIILSLAAVLGYFFFFPRLAGVPTGSAAVLNMPPRPVAFVVATRGTPIVELPVSGMVEPSRETAIYARTTGYARDWLADLGDKVKAGQVLAELDTPEVDHQLVEARASADQAKASLALAQNEADRWIAMVATHAVSQQDADARIAARNGAQANYDAAEANVGRLVDLEMFKEIRAPYAGMITNRNLEVGTLVGSGPGPAGSELFRLIQTDPVRVFVNVPEAQALAIHAGVPAKLEVAAFPGRVFTGQVVRDAGALDPQSHQLRTEVHVANPDGALMPGTLADVHLLLLDHASTLLVPTSALVTHDSGPAVVRIVPNAGRDIARFTAVTVGRGFGSQVEILSSLQDGDRLVVNPPPDLRDGMVVDAHPLESASTSAMPTFLPPHPSAPRA
jgi:membrane fusion protein (multidrug efflux system)